MYKSQKRKIFILISIIVIFITCLYLAIFAGYKDFGENLLTKIFHISNDSDSIILEVLRLPRAVKALVAGACLAVAGMLMQAVSKNPLAEPYITGISSGAALGMVISILLFNSANYSFFGFVGAIFASLIVIVLSGFKKFSVTKLILVGFSLNIFASSLISIIMLTNAEKAYPMMLILSGGVSGGSIISVKTLVIFFLLALVACFYVIPKLNFLRLDNDIAFEGHNKRKLYTTLILVLSSFLTALSVFAAGILGFVGIIIPQISKMLVGQDYRWLFFVNLILGASFLLFSDYLARVLVYPLQLPLGLVIAFIGAPIFVFFLTKKGDIFND